MTITDAELDRLEELARAATPGPWKAVEVKGGHHGVTSKDNYPNVVSAWSDWEGYGHGSSGVNAAYIAAANPECVQQLIEDVRALRSAISALMYYKPQGNAPAWDYAQELIKT